MSTSNGRILTTATGLIPVALAAFAIVLAVWGVLAWGAWDLAVRERIYPIPQPHCANNSDCQDKALQIQAREAAVAEAAVESAILQGALSFAGLILVGLTAYYAHKAWREAEKSVNTQERALAAASRPYLVSDGTILDDGRGAGTKAFRFKLTNFGAGPAFVRRFYVGIIIDAELPAVPDYPHLWDVNFSVPPNGRFGSDDSRPTQIVITAEQSQDIVNGTRRVFVYGIVEYDDIWRANHRTRFAHALRLYATAASDTFVVAGDPAYWEST